MKAMAPRLPVYGNAGSAKHTAGRNENGHVFVRHPALPGPHMEQPNADYKEIPSGSVSSTPPGGIMGGLAPFQNTKGATNGDFNPGQNESAKGFQHRPATY